MTYEWRITRRDCKQVKDFVRANRRSPFVRHRVRRNLRRQGVSIRPATVWHVLVSCLLTTQQRSGPHSHVYTFINSRPFPLRLAVVARKRDLGRFVARTLRKAGGIRRVDVIGKELAENLRWFHGAQWRQLRQTLEPLTRRHGYRLERDVADWLRSEFRGLGPKQSRNLLQMLGLSLYEIPIDSRITKWLNDFGFPVALTPSGLSDPAYYAFVADGVRELCRAAGVAPCVLDAAIFSSVDGDAWSDVPIRW